MNANFYAAIESANRGRLQHELLQTETGRTFSYGDLTRESARYVHGLSPRAGLSLLAAARAWALLDGRSAVIPEDVQAVLPGVAAHRLQSVQFT